jgi:hypothetical protein
MTTCTFKSSRGKSTKLWRGLLGFATMLLERDLVHEAYDLIKV